MSVEIDGAIPLDSKNLRGENYRFAHTGQYEISDYPSEEIHRRGKTPKHSRTSPLEATSIPLASKKIVPKKSFQTQATTSCEGVALQT